MMSIHLLQQHDVVPGTIEMTRGTFERLKQECWLQYICERQEPDHFMGVRIVVKD